MIVGNLIIQEKIEFVKKGLMIGFLTGFNFVKHLYDPSYSYTDFNIKYLPRLNIWFEKEDIWWWDHIEEDDQL